MPELNKLFQSADWKSEKHVPVIDALEKVARGELFDVTVSVGKEIAHPNQTEHHICWIDVYFLPEGEKFPCQLGKAEFCSHGASAHGPDTSTIYTHPRAVLSFKTDKPGTILAFSYCNIHGLWQNAAEIDVE